MAEKDPSSLVITFSQTGVIAGEPLPLAAVVLRRWTIERRICPHFTPIVSALEQVAPSAASAHS